MFYDTDRPLTSINGKKQDISKYLLNKIERIDSELEQLNARRDNLLKELKTRSKK
jgi:hypothetical protein